MVHIVGAGLAGSILKRVLDQHKIKNVIYDAEKPWRASIISENLFSLTWANTLGPAVFQNGLKTLESIVDIQAIPFKTVAGHNNVLHVHPDNILVREYKGEVTDLNKLKGVVVDCRGYWAAVPAGEMVGLTGQGMFIKGKLKREPEMNFVAPYTHQKLFQWNKNSIWYADSTCVDYSKYKAQQGFYEDRCYGRASKLLGYQPRVEFVHGIRPWVKPNKGYLRFYDNRIVNTGGWKCGLVIYADHAQKILKHLTT